MILRVAERVVRSALIGYAAGSVWLRYKGPSWLDRIARRDPEARDLSAHLGRRGLLQLPHRRFDALAADVADKLLHQPLSRPVRRHPAGRAPEAPGGASTECLRL